MKRKKIVSMLLASAMAATLLAGCGAGGKSSSKGDSDGEIKEFTAFFAVPGSESMMIMRFSRSLQKKQAQR